MYNHAISLITFAITVCFTASITMAENSKAFSLETMHFRVRKVILVTSAGSRHHLDNEMNTHLVEDNSLVFVSSSRRCLYRLADYSGSYENLSDAKMHHSLYAHSLIA